MFEDQNKAIAKFENMGMDDRITAGLVRTTGWNDYWADTNVYHSYWPTFSKNTFEQAFKVVSMLIENGYLKGITLKQFIKIVKEVEGEL